jgi:hypothetical protein
MDKKTEEQYRKMAKAFYSANFRDEQYGKQLILSKLSQISSRYQPKSFTNLKRAISYVLMEEGHNEIAEAVKSLENRAVTLGYHLKKNKKIKTVSVKNMKKINNAVRNKKNDKQLQHAVVVLKVLGIRPIELNTTKRVGPGKFLVISAKKDEHGEKGLDRIIAVESEDIANTLEYCLKQLDNVKIRRVQDRFSYLMKTIFPRWKNLPTMYIYRHQLGSNLKSSSLTRIQMAYLMGHQSTRSLESYGYCNAGSAGGLMISPGISSAEIASLVRDKYSERQKTRKKRLSVNTARSRMH